MDPKQQGAEPLFWAHALSGHSVTRTNLGLAAAAVTAAALFASPLFAASLALGALFEHLNFRGLYRSAAALVLPDGPGAGRGFGVMGPRFALLAVAIGVALKLGAHPVGLVIGLSLVVPAAVIEAWRARPPIDPTAPALAPDDESWDRWDPWLAREREPDADEDEIDANATEIARADAVVQKDRE
jgi:hypothetical protein